MNDNQYLRMYYPTSLLTSSWPVHVMQVGSRINITYADPFFVHLPSDNQFVNVPTQFMTGFNTYDQVSIAHFLRITTVISWIGMISIDGVSPSPLLYNRVGRGSFYYYETLIQSGVHTVAPFNTTVRYSAVVYGYGPELAYGFAPGIDLPGTNC